MQQLMWQPDTSQVIKVLHIGMEEYRQLMMIPKPIGQPGWSDICKFRVHIFIHSFNRTLTSSSP